MGTFLMNHSIVLYLVGNRHHLLWSPELLLARKVSKTGLVAIVQYYFLFVPALIPD